MASSVTLTLAGDEAGDVSFAFGKGASRFFVFALIATTKPDDLREVLAQLRADSNLKHEFEFKFNHMTSATLRHRVLNALAVAPFESWALIVDKTTLPDTFAVMRGIEVYLYFVAELLRLIPTETRQDATLILDEFGSVEQVQTELRRVLDARRIPRHFKRVLIRRSRSEPLIQIADIVAGAVLRRDSKDDAEAFDILEPRISSVVEYGS